MGVPVGLLSMVAEENTHPILATHCSMSVSGPTVRPSQLRQLVVDR